MLNAGDKAPEFVLRDDEGNEISLTDLLQDGPLILYFYPADFTPGCTKEACSIRDIHDDIQSVGLRVAGVAHAQAVCEVDPVFEVIRLDVRGLFPHRPRTEASAGSSIIGRTSRSSSSRSCPQSRPRAS